MKRFDKTEVRAFWQTHGEWWAQVDDGSDRDALANVIVPGGATWLNRYFAWTQTRTYAALLDALPPPPPGATALEVGCGAARWCRVLRDRGYRVTGVDMQRTLIEQNQRNHPDMTFVCGPIQEFTAAQPFDLISHVTVVQHVPHDEQPAVVRRLRELCRTGGHVLALENTLDQGPHTFANSIRRWCDLYAQCGFRCVRRRRYDYSPTLRTYMFLRSGPARLLKPRSASEPARPETYLRAGAGRREAGTVGALRTVDAGFQRVAVAADRLWEFVLSGVHAPVSSNHCGFLFQAT